MSTLSFFNTFQFSFGLLYVKLIFNVLCIIIIISIAISKRHQPQHPPRHLRLWSVFLHNNVRYILIHTENMLWYFIRHVFYPCFPCTISIVFPTIFWSLGSFDHTHKAYSIQYYLNQFKNQKKKMYTYTYLRIVIGMPSRKALCFLLFSHWNIGEHRITLLQLWYVCMPFVILFSHVTIHFAKENATNCCRK